MLMYVYMYVHLWNSGELKTLTSSVSLEIICITYDRSKQLFRLFHFRKMKKMTNVTFNLRYFNLECALSKRQTVLKGLTSHATRENEYGMRR